MWKVAAVVAAMVAVAASQEPAAAAESWLSNISENLHTDMSKVLETMATVNYSTPVINATYVARVEFDMRAMGHLYNNTHMIIDVIANKQAYPEGIVSVLDGHVEIASAKENWRPLLSHYGGPVAVVVVVALLVAILPLTALFWCCCQWCRVGRRRRPFDRKYDACIKGILAIVLIALLTLFLFGVVCAFATDSQVESGAAQAPAALRASLRDARTFLNATQAHARHLLVTNYRELQRRLDAMIISSGLTVSMHVAEFSQSVTRLNRMVQQLTVVKDDLLSIQTITADLRTKAETLNTGLRNVKARLLHTLQQCREPKCVQLQEKYRIGELATDIHYNKLPDVSELLGEVRELLNDNITAEVAAGQAVLRDIQAAVQAAVDDRLPAVSDVIADTGKRLEAVANNLTATAERADAALAQKARLADDLHRLHRDYGPYRRYVGAAAAAALLAIVVAMAWGLICGVCGKRPDVYGASDCCNKGAGSSCLLCGIGVTLIVGGAVSLVLLLYFVFGVASQRFLCDPLTEPRDNRVFMDVERFVALERHSPPFNLTDVVLRCHQNLTLYETLQLERVYELEAEQARARQRWGGVVGRLHTDYPPRGSRLRLLRDPAVRQLRRLQNASLAHFDFDRVLHALETNMTSLPVDDLAAQLSSTAQSLATRPAFAAVAADLRDTAARLRDLHNDVLQPMLRDTRLLNSTATKLRDELRFNQPSMNVAIGALLHEISDAERYLNSRGRDLVQNLTRQFAEVVGARLQEYLARVSNAARYDVGRCGPLSNAFNATRDAACAAFLMPANGYWISLAWCVLLFAPLIVVATRLARLYRHADPYPGPLVEAEYLYDAYADRDNVPLANGSKRSTLDIEGKIAEWRGRGGGGGGGGAGEGGQEEGAEGAAGAGTQLLLEGRDVVCQLLPPPALIDDLKTRLDAKDEDNESGIHDAE